MVEGFVCKHNLSWLTGKVKGFKTCCWSWQVVSQLWVIASYGVPAIKPSKLAHMFPWTLAIPSQHSPVPAVILKGLWTGHQNRVLCIIKLHCPLLLGLRDNQSLVRGCQYVRILGGCTDQDMNNMRVDRITESQNVVGGIVWVCRIFYKIKSEPSWVNTALWLCSMSCFCIDVIATTLGR